MHIILDLDQTLINTESNILPYSTNDVPNVVHLQPVSYTHLTLPTNREV